MKFEETRKKKYEELLRTKKLFCLASAGGSHTIGNHVKKDDLTLIRRLKGTGKVSAATSFYDYNQAEAVIEACIYNDEGEFSNLKMLADWLADTYDWEDMELTLTFNQPIGYGYSSKDDWSEGSKKINTVLVVLIKEDYTNGIPFAIRTAYPIFE